MKTGFAWVKKIAMGGLLSLTMISCSSSSSEKGGQEAEVPDPNRPGGQDRNLETRVKKWDLSRRSAFEKGDQGSRDNRYFQQSAMKKNEYKGNTQFRSKNKTFKSGQDGFRTKEFNQSDKSNRMASQEFREGKNRNAMGEDRFKTQESRYANQSLRDGNKTSNMDGERFKVPVDRETSRAMERSKRPVILENANEPNYTESEVGSFLGRF